jgi:(2R)-3-sulfolactate dehydrogenase (NADP+)
MTLVLTLDAVEALAARALRRAGASALQAGATARSIRDAEAEGARSIGLGYLPTYVRHLEVGKVRGDAVPVVTRPRPAAVAVDADCGFAHPAFVAAEEALVAAARAEGLAAMGVTNSYASGVVGWFVDRLARRGLVAFAVTNASALVAPWGGKRAFFGTDPFAFAAPRQGAEPLVVDTSSSATAYVAIATAAAEGRAIPPGWALDAEGRPTTDPKAMLAGGTVAPAGGHKGFALALMVETLAAGLTGANWSHRASSLGDDHGGPPRIGQFYLAVDPGCFGAGDLPGRLSAMLEDMTADPGVRVPGDRRHANRRRAEAEGVAVDEPLAARLRAMAGD